MSKRPRRRFVEIPVESAVITTGNHGGYMTARCIVCGASGWLNGKLGLRYGTPDTKEWGGSHLAHKKFCGVNPFAAESRDK